MNSLFTNAPLDETIKVCIDELSKSEMTISVFNKQKIFEMLSVI